MRKALCVDLGTGKMQLEPVPQFEALSINEHQCTHVYGPRYHLLLVGAGQIAECLVQVATLMDYRVLVTDPRADQLNAFQTRLSGRDTNVECLSGMPDDVVREYDNDPFSIVITLTHDPRIDDMALMEALALNNFYVGALGSRQSTAKRLQRLQQLDLPPRHLDRLHAPVGLSIGSKTAAASSSWLLVDRNDLAATSERRCVHRLCW